MHFKIFIVSIYNTYYIDGNDKHFFSAVCCSGYVLHNCYLFIVPLFLEILLKYKAGRDNSLISSLEVTTYLLPEKN